MWILGADTDEEAASESIERISKFITDRDGEVVNAEPWGRRSLSYEIKKSNEGLYFLAFFKLAPEATPELERVLGADQAIIRHLLLRHDKPVPVAADSYEADDRRGGSRRGRRT